MTHHSVTKWLGGVAFESDNPGGEIIFISASEENGGDGTGLRPKALMLSALAGCSGLDVASLLPKMKVTVAAFHIEVTGELTEEHPKYYNHVQMVYHFYGKQLEKDKLKKIVYLSVDKYCGVMEMFRKFAQVDIAIEYHPLL